jgi:hypothetical protein
MASLGSVSFRYVNDWTTQLGIMCENNFFLTFWKLQAYVETAYFMFNMREVVDIVLGIWSSFNEPSRQRSALLASK